LTKINYIDTKEKCRHLKKPACKGTLRQVFIRIYRLEIQSVILVFSTQLCELLLLNLLSGSTHSPPSLCQSTVYKECGREGMWDVDCWSCWRPYSAGGYHSVPYLTRFRTYKIARPRQTKTKEASDRSISR
jgi:hypothetical protein